MFIRETYLMACERSIILQCETDSYDTVVQPDKYMSAA